MTVRAFGEVRPLCFPTTFHSEVNRHFAKRTDGLEIASCPLQQNWNCGRGNVTEALKSQSQENGMNENRRVSLYKRRLVALISSTPHAWVCGTALHLHERDRVFDRSLRFGMVSYGA